MTTTEIKNKISELKGNSTYKELKQNNPKVYYTIQGLKNKLLQEPKTTPLQELMSRFMVVNGISKVRNGMSYELWIEDIATISTDDNANDFIKDLCNSVERYMNVSQKQAYYLAMFVQKYNVNLK